MDALQISGKWHISSRRAAKEHGYHSDYIGQLIRMGKVKGQKVGRAWYVAADSLEEYLKSEKSIEPVSRKGEIESVEEKAQKLKKSEIISVQNQSAVSDNENEDCTADAVTSDDQSPVSSEELIGELSIEDLKRSEINERESQDKITTNARSELKLMTYLKDEEREPISLVRKNIVSSKGASIIIPIKKYETPVETLYKPEITTVPVSLITPKKAFYPKETLSPIRFQTKLLVYGVLGVLTLITTVFISVFLPYSVSINL